MHCYFCPSQKATLVCSNCQVARYCNAACRDKAETVFKHSQHLCRFEQDKKKHSSSLPLMSSTRLGVRIVHDGAIFTNAEHAAAYEWFKDLLVYKGHVPPMLEPVPIDGFEVHPTIPTRTRRLSANRERRDWLQKYGLNAERYAAFVLDFADSLGYSTGDSSQISANQFFTLVADACYRLERNPQFFDKDQLPHVYRSLTEQVWYYFATSGNNVILKEYEKIDRQKRLAQKRKADEVELSKFVDHLKEYKRQRVQDFTAQHHHHQQQEDEEKLPYELYSLIAQYLPLRDVFNLLTAAKKEQGLDYNLEWVTKLVIQRDFPQQQSTESPAVQVTVDRLMRKFDMSYPVLESSDKSKLFKWFLTDSLLKDYHLYHAQPQWWWDMRSYASHEFNQIAMFAADWVLPNRRPTGILLLYYNTVAFTMSKVLVSGEHGDPIIIVGASGIQILGKYSDEFSALQLTLSTPPLSDLELEVAERLVDLNEEFRKRNGGTITGHCLRFCRFLISCVDPTITMWASIKTILHGLPRMNIYVGKDSAILPQRAKAEILANCVQTGLCHGARYYFDFDVALSQVTKNNDPNIGKSYIQTIGAAYLDDWIYHAAGQVFGIESNVLISDDEANDDDGDVLII
jgi:hypothetical protein